MPKNELAKHEQLKKDALEGKIILASREGINALEDKIELVKKEEARVKHDLGEAAKGDPDLPENTEFKELKVRLQFEIPRMLRDLNNQLNKAQVYGEDQDGRVRFGTSFIAELHFGPEDVESNKYQLLGPLEALYGSNDSNGQIISYLTPLGMRIWTDVPGISDSVSYFTPGGNVSCIIREIYNS